MAQLQSVRQRRLKYWAKAGLLKQRHPDFEDLRGDDDFHAWAKEQPGKFDWIYNNPDNVTLASKAIDLYKLETASLKQNHSRRQSNKAVWQT